MAWVAFPTGTRATTLSRTVRLMHAMVACRAAVHRLALLGVLVALLLAVTAAPAGARGPADVVVTPNVPYGTDAGEQLRLDVYQPPAAGSPRPLVILIHGGGWVSGDKADAAPLARSVAAAGFVVFAINYSLDLSAVPAYPREVTDVHTALTWVRQHAAEFHGDAGRIGVAGASAGAYLAAMLGTQANTATATPVRAVISLSGPMDVGALVADVGKAVTPSGQCAVADCADVQKGTERLRALLGCDPLQCPAELVRASSPITYVTSDSPPFFLANSADEIVPASQATRMANALRSRNVPVQLKVLPGDGHGLDYAPRIRDQLMSFLKKNVALGTPAAEGARASATRATDPGGGPSAAVLRWLALAALCLVAGAGVAARRRSSAKSAPNDGDPLGAPHPSRHR
jgi:acetyl esterase